MPLVNVIADLGLLFTVAVSHPMLPTSHADATSPCEEISEVAAISRVQRSDTFTDILGLIRAGTWPALDDDAWHDRSQDICQSMKLFASDAIGEIAIVYFPAHYQTEVVHGILAVVGDSVAMLNPVNDRAISAGLDIDRWNLVAGWGRGQQLAGAVQALRYACIVVSLAANAFPEDLCAGEERFSIAEVSEMLEIELGRLALRMEVSRDGIIQAYGQLPNR